MLLRRRAEALDALQHIVNTAFRRELEGDRALVVDCLDYRKAQGRRAEADGAVPDGEGQDDSHAAGDGAAQPLRAPARAPHRCRGSADVVGEHRRRVPEDGDHFGRGSSDRGMCSAACVQHHRHHRCHRNAARPWRHRRGPHQRGECRSDRAGHDGDGASRSTPRHATLTNVRGSTSAPSTASSSPSSPRRIRIPARTWRRSARTAVPVLLRAIVSEAMRNGARLAEPGEFTLRAYLNDRIDLVQAEAVRDLVNAVTPLQARAAFDQLEGTLTADIREIDRALLDLTARLEASLDFPGRGVSLRGRQRGSRRDCGGGGSHCRAPRERRTGTIDPRRTARGPRRPAQHRQVVAVQRARRRRPRHRHRRARDDAGPVDGSRGHRGRAGDDRRYGRRPAGSGRCDRSRRHRARSCRPPDRLGRRHSARRVAAAHV